jgi:xylose isomerase
MCLHIIHKLRTEGIDNIQVNMDRQHLIMNGENLAEYAALLSKEGLLGHQHGNSEDKVAAVGRSVKQWRFIDGIAAKIDDDALREAQSRKDAVRAYELVYAALGA